MLQFFRFAAVRAALAILTLVLVSFIVFSLMELVPGDCAERYIAFKASQGSVITAADVDAERVRLGLNRPYITRWVEWIGNAFQGEFGDSCIQRLNISQLLGQKFWLSLRHMSFFSIASLCHRNSSRHSCGNIQKCSAEQLIASCKLPRFGTTKFLAGTDDHAVLNGDVRRQPHGAIFKRITRCAVVL